MTVRPPMKGRRQDVATRKQRGPKNELDTARGVAQWAVVYQAYNAVFKVAELTLLAQRLTLPQFHLSC
jgi:hypothetical protein